ncbi:hypothetical protein HY388_02185 [Candidatus Daviesbacteria bacterium]|nr:hypothetical protein [Candidatus Daviesbacteria bacterium]
MSTRTAEVERNYWRLNSDEKNNKWAELIAQSLGISPDEAARRIKRNNLHPLEETEAGQVVYPRFMANASLLAQASPYYDGPRGPRPLLASASNILRISGITYQQVIEYGIKLKQISGGISKFLIELKITAANPDDAPEGVQFSNEDIRRGIYIPGEIDRPTAAACGIAYGHGYFGNASHLDLSSSMENLAFLQGPVRLVFEQAFNFLPDHDVKPVDQKSQLKPDGYKFLHLGYGSKAVGTYFLKILQFPRNRELRRKTGLSTVIKGLSRKLQDEFLKYFLASTVAFDQNEGLLRISDVSQPLLQDIESMISARVTKQSISLRPQVMSRGFILSLSTIPAMELFLLGLLNENPTIKQEVEQFWNSKIKSRAWDYLKRTYGLSETS